MLSDKNHNIEVLSWSSSFSNDIYQTSLINTYLKKYWHKYNLSIMAGWARTIFFWGSFYATYNYASKEEYTHRNVYPSYLILKH